MITLSKVFENIWCRPFEIKSPEQFVSQGIRYHSITRKLQYFLRLFPSYLGVELFLLPPTPETKSEIKETSALRQMAAAPTWKNIPLSGRDFPHHPPSTTPSTHPYRVSPPTVSSLQLNTPPKPSGLIPRCNL